MKYFVYLQSKKKEEMTQKLTRKEEEVMNIIWKKGNVFIREILAEMPDPKPNYNTVATQVKFLEEKGFVTRKAMANSFQYTPRVSEKKYRGVSVGNLVSRYFNNSYSYMISQFIKEDRIGLDELKEIIEKIERDRK